MPSSSYQWAKVTSTQRNLTDEQGKGNIESLKVNLVADQRI